MANWGNNAPTFDTLGSVYGSGSSPSYYSSDLNGPTATPGGALSTTPTGPANPVNSVTVLPDLDGTAFGQPVTWWFMILGGAILVYYLIHKSLPNVEKELATPRFGLGSFWSVGVQATLFIVIVKAVLTKWRVPGLTELVASA